MRRYTPDEAKGLAAWLLMDAALSMDEGVEEVDDDIIITLTRGEFYFTNGELTVLTDVLHRRDGVIDVYDVWAAEDLGDGRYKLLAQVRVETTEWENVTEEDLVLLRSDEGDGAWSLHPPGTDFHEDRVIVLASGEANWVEDWDGWDRPNAADYAAALAALEAQNW